MKELIGSIGLFIICMCLLAVVGAGMLSMIGLGILGFRVGLDALTNLLQFLWQG